MNRQVIIISAAAVAAGACSMPHSTITDPSAVSGVGVGTSRVLTAAAPSYDEAPRARVTFTALGNVLVENLTGRAQVFVFVVRVSATPIFHAGDPYQIAAVTPPTLIPAGVTAELSLAFPETCGAFYSRDVWESALPQNGRLYTDGSGRAIPAALACGTPDGQTPDVTPTPQPPTVPPGCRYDPGAPGHYRCDARE